GTAGFLAVLLFSFRFEAGGGNHIRFIPLRILSRRRGGPRPLILMAPFALASVAGFLFSLFFSDPLPGPASAAVLDDRYFINKADYEAHADFQASFFLRPLGGGPSEG
ncbi:MAG: hypothetical protein LBL43_04460, partial [Treponema sp.]|nr:hypothetical protein [Treponema sp.]